MSDDRTAAASELSHRRIQRVLRYGLVLGIAAMALGLIIDLVEGDMAAVAVPLHSLLGVGSMGDRAMAVGILILALTPVARVVALVIVWWREHDRRFALVGLTVLAVLALGAFLGRG